MTSIHALRTVARVRWIPPPIRQLVEPYLAPGPQARLGRPIPSASSLLERPTPTPVPSISTSSAPAKRKVYVRRGVIRESTLKVKSRPLPTLSGVKTRIRSAISSSSSDGGDPLQVAIGILEAHSSAASSSDLLTYTNTRSSLYNTIIYEFLHHPSPTSLSSIIHLFNLQQSESIPVDPQILTIYLKSALASSTPSGVGLGAIETIASIFPFLPLKFDLHLLTLILASTIRHAQTPAEEVKSMITACLMAQNQGHSVRMTEWHPELWDVYFGALLAEGRMKEAIRALPTYRAAVFAQKTSRTGGSTPTAEGRKGLGAESIARVYITLLRGWMKAAYQEGAGSREGQEEGRRRLSAKRSREFSTAPRSIVVHCLVTLAGGDIPVELLNTWMAAEVVSGNYNRVDRIWEVISGLRVTGRLAGPDQSEIEDENVDEEDGNGQREAYGEAERLEWRREMLDALINPNWQSTDRPPVASTLSPSIRPDSSTYTALFRLCKRSSRYPSRRLIRAFLSDPTHIDVQSLNGALSTLFSTLDPASAEHAALRKRPYIDIPAALVILQHFSRPHSRDESRGEIVATARTLDIVSAGLLRLHQSGLQFFRGTGNQDSDSDGKLGEYRMSLKGWDRISQELHLLRAVEVDGTGEGMKEEVLFPIGRPLARLVESTLDSLSGAGAGVEGDDLARDFLPGVVVDRERQVMALIPALERLMKRAIRAQLLVQGEVDVGVERVLEVVHDARVELGVVMRDLSEM